MKLMIAAAIALLTVARSQAVTVSIQPSVTISWQGQLGKFYQVSTTTNLSQTTWTVIESGIIGGGKALERSYPSTQDKQFFKVDEITRPDLRKQLIYNLPLTNAALTQVIFDSSDVIAVDFTGSLLNVSDFNSAMIDQSDFTGTDLRSASFIGCPYISAVFEGATAWNTLFNGSYMFLCDFRNAVFNPMNPDFQGASLEFCDFTGATGFVPDGGHFVMCLMPDGSLRNDP